eukprot:m.258285 g.258285  ORF g.258285 m.258285 type:complete len:208 (-) comp36384_c0_seq1:274-897(-)
MRICDCSVLCLYLRLLQRRCLKCIGFGKDKPAEVLLPTHVAKDATKPVTDAPSVWHGVPDPASVDKEAESWNTWTEKAKTEMQAGPVTREERQAKKIDNLFSMMEPKVIKQKKAALTVSRDEHQGRMTSPKTSAGSRLAMGPSLSNTLGSLSDEEEEVDGWGDDELNISDVKAVERDAIRKAREERRKIHEVERKSKRTELKGKLLS